MVIETHKEVTPTQVAEFILENGLSAVKLANWINGMLRALQVDHYEALDSQRAELDD